MRAQQTYFWVAAAIFAVLLGMTFEHALAWLVQVVAWPDPYFFSIRELTMTAAIGYGAALATTGGILSVKRWRQLGLEIVDELLRVNWPTLAETKQATLVVIVTVLLSSVCLGVFDAWCLWLSGLLLGGSTASGT